MEELGFMIIFWYGVLHAFGADHISAIADFSIGKSKRNTFLITIAFAVGHGIMLFIFAKILQTYQIPEYITGYGDIISSSVIILMGFYLLYMALNNKIHLKKHYHNNKEHIHIWFGDEHKHNNSSAYQAFTIGALMGIGGVRGMLITLGIIEHQIVDFGLVFMFVLGVSVVFVGFGLVILYINQNFLNSTKNIKRVFSTAGIISVLVGFNMLLG
jgi:cytochrome c biogenesis protein CcdA